jgi:hypothetical protein
MQLSAFLRDYYSILWEALEFRNLVALRPLILGVDLPVLDEVTLSFLQRGKRLRRDSLSGLFASPESACRCRDAHAPTDLCKARVRKAVLFGQPPHGRGPDFFIELSAFKPNEARHPVLLGVRDVNSA